MCTRAASDSTSCFTSPRATASGRRGLRINGLALYWFNGDTMACPTRYYTGLQVSGRRWPCRLALRNGRGGRKSHRLGLMIRARGLISLSSIICAARKGRGAIGLSVTALTTSDGDDTVVDRLRFPDDVTHATGTDDQRRSRDPGRLPGRHRLPLPPAGDAPRRPDPRLRGQHPPRLQRAPRVPRRRRPRPDYLRAALPALPRLP